MPPRRINPPPEVMRWGNLSAILAVSVSVIFDILRLACEMLWLFGPAVAGIYCQQKLSGSLGEALSAAVCATGATTLGTVASPTFMLLGTVLAMVVGIFGWMTIVAIIILSNERLVKENLSHVSWLAGSLLVSEIPLLGSLPALTATVIKLYSAQIKRDKELLQEYEASTANSQQEEQNQQSILALQIQQARIRASQEEIARQTAEAADEIPDEMRTSA